MVVIVVVQGIIVTRTKGLLVVFVVEFEDYRFCLSKDLDKVHKNDIQNLQLLMYIFLGQIKTI